MTAAETLAKALESAESSTDYWRDIAITDFTRDLHARMKALDISQGELARRMGTSRPYITKLLEGSNFTLQTMVKLAMALEAVVRLRLEGKEERAEAQRAAQLAAEHSGVVIDFGRRRIQHIVITPDADSGAEPITVKWGAR